MIKNLFVGKHRYINKISPKYFKAVGTNQINYICILQDKNKKEEKYKEINRNTSKRLHNNKRKGTKSSLRKKELKKSKESMEKAKDYEELLN